MPSMNQARHIAEFRYCWVCTGEFAEAWPRTGDVIHVDCATCGKYDISETLYASAFPLADSERYRMSHWSKRRQLESREPPRLTAASIGAVVAELPNPAVYEKPGVLLLSLTRAYAAPGQGFKPDMGRQYSLACARNGEEAEFFLRGLVENGDVSWNRNSASVPYSITLAGWKRAAQMSVQPHASRTGFVAMHFSDEMLGIYPAAFAPAIERAGFEPRLANLPAHNEQIDARIVNEIRQSRFVVADVTGARTGVYFEAGYALGYGRTVIWTCRDTARNDMHFDRGNTITSYGTTRRTSESSFINASQRRFRPRLVPVRSTNVAVEEDCDDPRRGSKCALRLQHRQEST
jgi:nucleoside 2-deoxyribosyltransferase